MSFDADAPSRAGLTAFLDDFLAALVSRNPAQAHLADTARYTENGQALAIGDGLWGTATALGAYRHDFIDVETANIATIATLTEGATRSILVARLQVARGRLSEIELIVARPDIMNRDGLMAKGPMQLDASGGPHAHWDAEVPPAARMARADLIRVADLYFAGLEKNDGKGDYPFAPDCVRIENGFLTTGATTAPPGMATPAPAPPAPDEARAEGSPYTPNFMAMSAKAQFESGYFRFVDRIRDRRFPVVDVERGLVFAFAFFDHSGTVRDYPLADGRIVTSGINRPFTWEIGEGFKIENGLFTRIEAVMTPCPYGMSSNWPHVENEIIA